MWEVVKIEKFEAGDYAKQVDNVCAHEIPYVRIVGIENDPGSILHIHKHDEGVCGTIMEGYIGDFIKISAQEYYNEVIYDKKLLHPKI